MDLGIKGRRALITGANGGMGLATAKILQDEGVELFVTDVGEDKVRPIGSGLRDFYKDASELEGRLVLVLCNLKPRELAGYNSHGMVLCASSAGKDKVEVVDPPAGAKVGERVTFEGVEGDFAPFAPNQVSKKKVFEAVAPNLKTDASRNPIWVGPDGAEHRFLTSAGPCAVPSIAGGQVS